VSLDRLKSIAFTHSGVGLDKVAKFFIPEDEYQDRFVPHMDNANLDEFMFLATCNRSEFYFATDKPINNHFLRTFYDSLYPNWIESDLEWAIENTQVVDGLDSVRHMFNVASSLDSLVVGEREIITQFRKAYDKFQRMGLTGEYLRLAERKTIETAKKVFTETDIANRPVSVVNLAYRELADRFLSYDAKIVVIGAGVTNKAMLHKMKKHGYHDFHVYNRTLENAEKLVSEVGGKAYSLDDLEKNEGFDALITCTGAPDTIVTYDVYKKLLSGSEEMKYVVDLAIPNDFDLNILDDHKVDLIEVETLKKIAKQNLEQRKSAIVDCEKIIDDKLAEFEEAFAERQIELAMREVPQQIKEVKEKAVAEVFAKQLSSLDDSSKEVMNEMLSYMERKVNAITMKKAKQIMMTKNR
jgi:glutamyl-tRNA reductase